MAKKKIPRAKRRHLWINISVRTSERTSRRVAIERLIESVEDGTYAYPRNWYVQISWRNKENARDRTGEFTSEMSLSKRSSPGFDMAVLSYLRGKL